MAKNPFANMKSGSKSSSGKGSPMPKGGKAPFPAFLKKKGK
jgi:hypothetical protein